VYCHTAHTTDSEVADSHRWSALQQALVWCTARQQQQHSSSTDASLLCAATPVVSLEVLSELTRVFNLRARTPFEVQGDAPRAQLLRWLAHAAGAMLLCSSGTAVQLITTNDNSEEAVVADDSCSSGSSSDAVTASAIAVSASTSGVCTPQHLKAAQYLQRAGLCDALDAAAVAQCLADRLLANTNSTVDAAAATTATTAAAGVGAAAEALQHKQRYSSAQLAGMCAATVAAGSSTIGRQLVRALLDSAADAANTDAAAVAVAARAEAVKWIVKLKLTDDREFVPVLLQNSSSSSSTYYSVSSAVSATGTTAAVHSDAQSLLPVLTLPTTSELAVVLVCDAASLTLARHILLPTQHTDTQKEQVVVGIDTEWRPFSTGQQRTRVSLVQVACSTHAFLFDFMSLEQGWSPPTTSSSSTCATNTDTDVHMQQVSSDSVTTQLYRELIQELLSSERVTKLAYGFDNDHR
jgi:hypothetical protein